MSSPGSCARVQETLWRYIDRELSAPALAEISAHLKACAECNRLYEARARDAKLFRMAFAGSPFGDGFAERFQRRLGGAPSRASKGPASGPADLRQQTASRQGGTASRQGGTAGSREGEDGGAEDGRSRGTRGAGGRMERLLRLLPGAFRANPRRLAGQAFLAAAMMLIGALVVFGVMRQSGLGTVLWSDVRGSRDARGSRDVRMVRGGKTLTSPPRDLRAGDELSIAGEGSKLHVRLADGTSMTLLPLDGVARFSVAEESRGRGPFLGRLEHGILHASVEPRRAGAELRIESGLATALVVGTRFTLWAEKGVRTMLQVDEGVVIFRGGPGEEAVLVNARKGRYQVRAVDREPRPVEVPRDPGPDASLDPETTGPQETIEPPRPDTLDPRPPARPSSPGIDMPYTPDRSER